MRPIARGCYLQRWNTTATSILHDFMLGNRPFKREELHRLFLAATENVSLEW